MNDKEKISKLESKIELLEKSLDEFKRELAACNKPKTKEPESRYDLLNEVEQKKIEFIMRHFDFAKVHDVMKQLGWRWIGAGGDGVPSIERLKEEARRLLVDACFEKTVIATGGFKATYEATPEDPDENEYVKLEFVVVDEEGFADDDDDDEADDWEA